MNKIRAVLTGVILFIYIAVLFYYKKEKNINGLLLSIIMAITALVLDALITVPLVMAPQGIGYKTFFTMPFLWLMVSEILIFTVLFSNFRVKKNG